jgi:hypothetical protein
MMMLDRPMQSYRPLPSSIGCQVLTSPLRGFGNMTYGRDGAQDLRI